MLRNILFLTLFVTLALFFSCSGSSNNSSDTNTTSENGLSEAYPTDLAITSPFATESAVEGLLKIRLGETLSTEIEVKPFSEKKEEILDRLKGDEPGKCGFSAQLFTPPRSVTCYGPSITFSGHPDAGAQPSSGTLPPGDLGIWKENEATTGEACAAAKINSLISEVQAQVDMAVNLVTGMLCIANAKSLDTLPSSGETKDFKESLQEAMDETETPFSIEEAKLARESEPSDGNAVYLSTITSSATIETKTITISVNLKHIPTSDDNSTYQGRLWYTISGSLGQIGNCTPSGPKMFAVSILYSKNSEGRLNYRMQRATYCTEDADPFDSNNNIDASNKFNATSNPGGWADNYHDGTFDLDASDGTGTLSYAWQAGSLDGNTRVFLAEIEAGSDDSKSGCGYFGFGPDAASSDVGNIDGIICNWAGPGNIHNPLQTKVQRQCMSFDSSSNKFASDSSRLNITYAPANSCDSAGSPFMYDGISTATTNNLIPLVDMQADITPPSKPGNI